VSGQRDIQFEGVSVEFAGRIALREVSIALDAKRIGVIGSNGSGKSTFARMLNGLVTPTGAFDGMSVSSSVIRMPRS